MNNTFIIEVLEDGKIKATSPGSFSGEIHKDADDFLKYMQELAGGETVIKKQQPNLGNVQHQHHGHHGHHHHH